VILSTAVMVVITSLTGRVSVTKDPGGEKGRVGNRTEFHFFFNRGAQNFFRELKESNLGTLFRD
jgi:hypothetical protein